MSNAEQKTDQQENTEETASQLELNEFMNSWLEVANVGSMFSTGVTGTNAADITIDDLKDYLNNPYENILEIRQASSYLVNKHGILKDILRSVKSMPTLKYNLIWSQEDQTRNEDDYKNAREFLKTINVKRLVRDGLYETAETGTVVTCLRSNEYVQFLDVNDLAIRKQRNGKWVVEVDLEVIDSIRDDQERLDKIESLPDEVTESRLQAYQTSGDDEDRYIEIDNCDVISIDSRRNSPYGLPMTLGAWLPILQKEIIGQVERSVSSRMLRQIITLTADFIDKDKKKPVPRPLLQAYFNEVSEVVTKKEDVDTNGASSGSGLISLPHFLKLDSVKVDNELFKEDLYDKLDNDIFMNLGVSPALIYGSGGNYASANVNEAKFFSYITDILEQFEDVLNGYLENLLPDNVDCRIILDKSTVLDKESSYEKYQQLFERTGIAKPWIESLFGEDSFEAMLEQAQYEKEVLGTESILNPPVNPYTTSPNASNNTPNNENTENTLDNDGNNTPSPSDN